MAYKTPNVNPNRVVLRSNRYIVIALADGSSFSGWAKQDCDYVCYDKLKTTVISLITMRNDGKLVCQGLGLYSTPQVVEDMKAALAWIPYESKQSEMAFMGR